MRHRLGTVENPRVHATTRRVVNEAFADERAVMRPLPLAPFQSVLKLERRISREGMVSVCGNFSSVPLRPWQPCAKISMRHPWRELHENANFSPCESYLNLAHMIDTVGRPVVTFSITLKIPFLQDAAPALLLHFMGHMVRIHGQKPLQGTAP
ncbi:hypothetical protein ABID25_006611 [Mesorhizobium abyssinicae]